MVARKSTSKAKATKSNTVVKVDMSDTSGQLRKEGDYIFTVVGGELKDSKSSEYQYINWKVREVESNAILYTMTSLSPAALFKLRAFLEACGLEVPQSAMEFDINDLVDAEFGGSVVIEEYEGNKRAVISDYFPAEEVEEGETEEEEVEEEEPEEEEEVEEEEEPEEEEETEEEEEDEPEEEEEPEEEAPPAKKTRGKKKAPAKKTIEVGSTVTFEDEDEGEVTGEVVAINPKKKVADVQVDDEVWEIDLSELTLA